MRSSQICQLKNNQKTVVPLPLVGKGNIFRPRNSEIFWAIALLVRQLTGDGVHSAASAL